MKNSSLIILLFIVVAFLNANSQAYQGFTLYSPGASTTSYLIDMNNTTVHTWSCNYTPGNTAYLTKEGHLLRTERYSGAQLNGGAQGGYISEYDWDGTLLWRYLYSSSTHLLHHDIEQLPNGNVLAIAWEVKSVSEVQAMGSSGSSEMWPLHIIEVEKTGATTGNIVWEWHAWDHLIQDYSPSKPNYGVVADHPELLNINNTNGTKPPGGGGDWIHANSIDYNDSLDQICFSSHSLNELFVIDHSTTTAEAASHAGGNSGKGGDFLYRWGNPQGYDQGTSADQQFYVVHNAQWIDYDLPGGGNFMVFNNGDGRPGGNSSSIDEWTPPVDAFGNYSYTIGTSFAPTNNNWSHTCTNYSNHLSAGQRLPNGNTMITEGTNGHFYEIDGSENTVWEFSIGIQECTKAIRYGCDYAGLTGLNLDCNCDVNGTAYIDDCDDCVGGNTGLQPCAVGVEDVLRINDVKFYPNPVKDILTIEVDGNDNKIETIEMFDVFGKIVYTNYSEINNIQIDVSSYTKGIYIIKINSSLVKKLVVN